MRLVTILPSKGDPTDPVNQKVAVVLPSGRLVTLGMLAEKAPDKLAEEIDGLSLATVVGLDPSLKAVHEALEQVGAGKLQEIGLDPAYIVLGPPVPRPGKIIGVGYNYMEHLREQGLEKPARPVLFSMFANAVTGDGDPVRKPAGTHALDFEAELAVVIGRRASGVKEASALSFVAGFTAANDITARDWQGQARALGPGEKGDGQWLRAKGSDTFLPLGPGLTPAGELGDGSGLRIRSWLTRAADGADATPVLMQDGNTSDMIFGVAELIAIISREVTLEPGDIIATGTPNGVGVFRDPPLFMEPGDVVRVEIDGIGSLTSPIADERGAVPQVSPAAAEIARRRVASAMPVASAPH
jgi:2-keto-4-pentenoate hydratase/2-oxohepta-3-ene-1,7-dioic acid hydratase in catechol pathway